MPYTLSPSGKPPWARAAAEFVGQIYPGHIIFLGFMGAGKSTVGQAVAAQLGLPFVDLDQEVAQKAQKSLRQLFCEAGEAAFRAQERAALRDILASQSPVVLATGGGTYIDPAMRQMLQQQGLIRIYLQLKASTVRRRLHTPEQLAARPLLDGPHPDRVIEDLLRARQEVYAQKTIAVITDDLDVAAVTRQVLHVLSVCKRDQPTRDKLINYSP